MNTQLHRGDAERAPAAAQRPDVDAIAALPPEDLDGLMGSARSHKVASVGDWLIRRARDPIMPSERIAELCERLLGAGLPLDRFGASTETLDAEHDAIGRLWVRGESVSERIYVRPLGEQESPGYLTSPFKAASDSGRWIDLWLPETDDAAFGIVPELKDGGFTNYLCIPVTLITEARGWFTFATRNSEGFSAADVAAIARVLPPLALLMEMRSTWVSLQTLLRTYVGTDPQAAILRGNVKRGQVTTITSAMLFADMRNSVGHTADLSATEAVAVFNTLFDCLVPPIESRHGEVLKYIGDGLLAIFRETEDCVACDAAERALAAAEEALRALDEHNLAHPQELPIRAGIALHYGEAAYGNVGSGVRLDFTVIGKDVGLASRIAQMNRSLNEPLLMSGAFAQRLREPGMRLGAFPARGFKDPVEVYRPLVAKGGGS